jgi:hypothetical protein
MVEVEEGRKLWMAERRRDPEAAAAAGMAIVMAAKPDGNISAALGVFQPSPGRPDSGLRCRPSCLLAAGKAAF